MTVNVAISSAGRRVALLRAFRAALDGAGTDGRVLALDMTTIAAAYHAADAGFLVPPCRDPGFIPQVLDICARESVHLLVPTIDTELPMYAAHRDDFERIGTRVLVSSAAVVEICADKRRTHAFLVEHRLPTVRQHSLEAGVEPPFPYPLILKPARGSSSVGVGVVASRDELATLAVGDDLIAQSIAPGVEYTIDAYVDDDGACRCAVPRRRIEVRAGEVSKAVTARLPELIDLAAEVVTALPGARGVITIQVFLDGGSGEINVIEINPRFGGGYPLALAAGADYPRWLIDTALGTEPAIDPQAWLDGLIMLRYDDAVFVREEPRGTP